MSELRVITKYLIQANNQLLDPDKAEDLATIGHHFTQDNVVRDIMSNGSGAVHEIMTRLPTDTLEQILQAKNAVSALKRSGMGGLVMSIIAKSSDAVQEKIVIAAQDIIGDMARTLQATPTILPIIARLPPEKRLEILCGHNVIYDLSGRADLVVTLIKTLPPEDQLEIYSADRAVAGLTYNKQGQAVINFLNGQSPENQRKVLNAADAVEILERFSFGKAVEAIKKTWSALVPEPIRSDTKSWADSVTKPQPK